MPLTKEYKQKNKLVQAWLPSDLAELFLEELKTSIDLVLRGSQ